MIAGSGIPLQRKKLYSLLLLDVAGQIEGATRFQKLMFILKEGFEISMPHIYIKYHYGPFSSQLRDEINFYVENGFIDANSECLGENSEGYPIVKTTYTLTESGRAVVKDNFSDEDKVKFKQVVDEWNNRPLKEVITKAKSYVG